MPGRLGCPKPPQPKTTFESTLLEVQLAVDHADAHRGAGAEVAAQDELRQRILDLLLDRTLEGPCAIHRIVARLADQVARLVIEDELDVAIKQPLAQVTELD